MENLKIGDKLKFIGDQIPTDIHRYEVRGVLGSIVFVREIFNSGVGPTDFNEIQDLITWGYTKE